ncbi:porin OmpL, partial [Aeromonas hydrophila]|nr:porin OmpL [Aeromonas hydrophila]
MKSILTSSVTHKHIFSRVNNFNSANGKDHHWELTSQTRYLINP